MVAPRAESCASCCHCLSLISPQTHNSFFLLIRQLFVSWHFSSRLNTKNNINWEGLWGVWNAQIWRVPGTEEGPSQWLPSLKSKQSSSWTRVRGSLLVSDGIRVSCAVGTGWGEEDLDSLESVHRLEKGAALWRPQVRLGAHHCHTQHQQPVTDGTKHTPGAHL